jgi:predicted amidohydrolase YtcJ
MLTTTGTKWITDGTPIERLAFLNAPYADMPGWFGQFNFPDDPFAAMIEEGRHGPPSRNQLLFHTVGDGAIDRVLDAMEAAGPRAAWAHRRTRLEHGDLLYPANFGRAHDLGIVVVQNARHLALPGVFLERVGPASFPSIQPLRSLLTEGIPLALGTDGIGQVSSPWLDVFLAAIHPTRPTEALTVEEAVIAYTRGAAHAEFEEHRKGSIAPGNLADLAVLSQDVFTVPLGALPATWSVMTMVGGEIVWDAGVL